MSSVNYVGSVSILDRGDAPAQAVIDRNARSLAQRVADETRDELEKVMSRVENIYGALEMSDEYRQQANMEYLNDIGELEDLIKDHVKKKKYQQQVTIFIIGYQEVCGQKLRLLQQVNEFFMENSKSYEEEDWFPRTPDLDLDDLSDQVQDSLETAQSLALRLGELNIEIVNYLAAYAEKKATNRGKKKLEKALGSAKDELVKLNDKLLLIQSDLDEKEEKMQSLFRQLEVKNLELQRFRSAAEIAKGRINQLSKEVEEGKAAVDETKREILNFHESQMRSLKETHQSEMDDIRRQHAEQIQQLMDELEEARRELLSTQLNIGKRERTDSVSDITRHYDLDASEPTSRTTTQQSTREGSKQDKSRQGSSASMKSVKSGKSPSKKAEFKLGSRASIKIEQAKEYAETAVQDEGGDPLSATVDTTPIPKGRLSKTGLPPVHESDAVDSAFDLNDDSAWTSVPDEQIPSRFTQYRKVCQKRMTELEDQLQLTQAKTQRKVLTLKAQFQDHKGKWEAERKLLLEQVSQAHKLQNEAEKEADSAMTQLEEFINEQEKIEHVEDHKRMEILNKTDVVAKGGKMRDQDHLKAEQEIADGSSPVAEQDLNQLLQQTDDAKVQELNARMTSGAMSAPPAVEGDEDAQLEKSPSNIEGITTEEIRSSSARSRASLRSQFRLRLEETKKVVDERRTKSPAVAIPKPRSLDDDVLNFDEEFVPDGFENKTFEMGTSPSFKRDDSYISFTDAKLVLADHPVVMDFVNVYDGVVLFKNTLSKILLEKDMMSASQILSDLDVFEFDRSTNIQPQISHMAQSIFYMLNEVGSLLKSVLVFDREPAVSSLMYVSRDQTKATLTQEETTEDVRGIIFSSRGSQRSQISSKSSSTVKGLQEQYQHLQDQFNNDSKRHEDQLRHNTVVMMEMQDTINELQRELSNLGKSARRSITPSQRQQLLSPETSVMFTRLDSDRNAKIMKKAVLDDRLGSDKYKEAVSQMKRYISLPAQRLGHLVGKYVHHCRMKAIEENVKKSDNLGEDVFEILDKMEALQNERARKWAEHMDDMGMQRIDMANKLMETLDYIEQESGLFLIKPMYSYRGRSMQQRYTGKMSRSVRQLRASPTVDRVSSLAPAPTPYSHSRSFKEDRSFYKVVSPVVAANDESVRPLEGDTCGISGSSVGWVTQSPQQTWNFSSSYAKNVHAASLNLQDTPRILELDINRMLIGQNNISSQISTPVSDDRLTNATHSNLRSYVTVNRHVATPANTIASSRPKSSAGTPRDSVSPGTTKKVRVADVDLEIPSLMKHTGTSPLPPINTDDILDSRTGSSLQQSPPNTSGRTLTTMSSTY